MNVQAAVRQSVKAFLDEHPAAAADLQGPVCEAWRAAHDLVLINVYQTLRKSVCNNDWREWLGIQDAVRHETVRLCEEMRR